MEGEHRPEHSLHFPVLQEVRSANPGSSDHIGPSLILAAQAGALIRLMDFARYASDLEFSGSDGETALIKACLNGHVDCALYLIKEGANIFARAADGRHVVDILHSVCPWLLEPDIPIGHPSNYDTRIKRPSHWNDQKPDVHQWQSELEMFTAALIQVTEKDDVETLQALCEISPKPNFGIYPALHAAHKSSANLSFDYLLPLVFQPGHDIFWQEMFDLWYHEVLLAAVALPFTGKILNESESILGRRDSIFAWLAKPEHFRSARIKLDQSNHPLMRACAPKAEPLAFALLANGINVNLPGDPEETPLCLASSHGNIELVMKIIDAGANLDARVKEGKTALIIACEKGKHDVVELLLERGARFDFTTDKGTTALMWAATHQDTNSMRNLLERGANLHAVNTFGMSAIHIATEALSLPCLKQSVAAGQDINLAGPDGDTPLHIAASNPDGAQLVAWLLQNGADRAVRNQAGQTPMDVAYASDNQSSIAVFISVLERSELQSLTELEQQVQADTNESANRL